MGMSSDRELVDRVRSAADIVRTVGEYLHLRKAGRRHVGLCPFHAEKTPSFSVDEQKQLFHCFGCGEGGDVFKFLMLHEKLEFREALEMLAEKHGIEIPRRQDVQPRGLKDRLYDANAAAAEYFRSALAHKDAGRPAREYLASRGIRSGTIERLGIGFAPREWEGLKRHLLGKGFTAAELATAGSSCRRRTEAAPTTASASVSSSRSFRRAGRSWDSGAGRSRRRTGSGRSRST
jgi:DNA primase